MARRRVAVNVTAALEIDANETHFFGRTGGKQAAEIFHAGDLGEGMRVALDDCHRRYPLIIEGWDR